MTQIIEIEGDLARIIERNVVAQAALADVIPHIERKIPVRTFVPKSAIYATMDQTGDTQRQSFLCEITPGIKVITKLNRRYRLAMPWTYMWLGMECRGDDSPTNWSLYDYRCFHTNEQVTSPQSRLWSAFLPNVYEDGRICFGTTGADANQPVHKRIDALVNTWYQTTFNNDVHGGRNHPLPFEATLPNGWRHWVNATQEFGATAWTRFPEWAVTDGSNGITSFTVEQVIATASSGRRAPITVVDAVPELVEPATFGRIEQWLHDLTNSQRARLLRGLRNMEQEQPEAIATLAPDPVLEDDGGEAV